jgi:uncharacterized phage-associated protein
MRGLDVRTVANIVLEVAEGEGVPVTNLHLNKSLYFMHVDCLRDRGHKLVSAKIEAWDYGPVFREIYGQFKRFGRTPISEKATRVDFVSGEKVIAMDELAGDLLSYVRERAVFYLSIPAGMLVDVSHAKGGAWDFVWNNSGSINAGMEITDEIIEKCELKTERRIRLQ